MRLFSLTIRILVIVLILVEPALAKTDVHLVEQGSVAAGSDEVSTTPIVPLGKVVKVKKFGCMAPALQAATWSYVILQWGNGGGWETVRVCYGSTEFDVQRDFSGDGSKRFRLVRRNKSTTTALDMGAWVEALVKD